MTRFRKNDNGEFNLEEDRSGQSYRWVSVEPKRLSSGHVNPPSVEESLKLHKLLLELAPHHLGISPVEIDYLDVLFGFDLDFSGNHDEIIAESLFRESPLTCLTDEAGAKAGGFPADGDGRAQRRLPAAGPHRRGHAHQQLPGPHRRLLRRCHQRLPDPSRFPGLTPKEPERPTAAKAEPQCIPPRPIPRMPPRV